MTPKRDVEILDEEIKEEYAGDKTVSEILSLLSSSDSNKTGQNKRAGPPKKLQYGNQVYQQETRQFEVINSYQIENNLPKERTHNWPQSENPTVKYVPKKI